MMTKFHFSLVSSAIFSLGLLATSSLDAQDVALRDTNATSSSSLPDSPGAISADSTAFGQAPASSSTRPFRFRGIISTRGLVQEGSTQPPQTVHDKFIIATEDNFNLYGVGAVGVVAGYHYGLESTPEFGKGGKGYARYYWHGYADRVIEIYSVELIAPIIFHQDTRFYYLGEGALKHRIGHAIRRTFVTRSNSGHDQFNYSEFVGSALASGVSTLYYPRAYRTASNAAQNWGINLGVDAFGFIIQEIYPSVIRAVFHRNTDPAP